MVLGNLDSCHVSAPHREPWKWYALLALPFAATLWVPSTTARSPRSSGLPFFYWYLFLWILRHRGAESPRLLRDARSPRRMNVPAAVVFFLLFALVTVLGFVASRWRRGDLDQLHEWGLGGRRFGTLVTWFLLGGDLYTAYTFIAVPALVYGQGAIGFFALPYTIIAFPIFFVVMPRLWSVSHARGYITGADFVRGRFESPLLALAVALTGLLATMPYIALQLVGIQVVVAALGIEGQGWMADLPLVIAFVILAAYTYNAGLRAPAMIAIVKDALIYVTVIAAITVIPVAARRVRARSSPPCRRKSSCLRPSKGARSSPSRSDRLSRSGSTLTR